MNYCLTDEFGVFKAVNYNKASLIEAQDLKRNDVLYYIIPPDSTTDRYMSKVRGNFSVFESRIYDKFEDILKKKLTQHKNSPITKKIFFFDSESIPELQMGLFQIENMFSYEKIDHIFKKLKIQNVILCITCRHYNQGQPVVFVDTFCSENLAVTSRYIKNLFLFNRHAKSI